MIVHVYNDDTGKTKMLFEAEYDQIRQGKALFTGEGKYIDSIGPTYKTYRLDFPHQNELKEFIEDLIELYNSREGEE